MTSGYSQLLDQLQTYKRKYYIHRLLRGALWSTLMLLLAYLALTALEYGLRFPSGVRALLFFSFVALGFWVIFRYILNPLWRLVDNRRQLSSEEAAIQIGHYFPEIGDKLVNTLQLQALSNQENALLQASIEQRSQELGVFTFSEAIPLRDNLKYLKYLALPFGISAALMLFYPQMLREGSQRIIRYQEEFVPVAPFSFTIANNDLTAFRNEDFTLELALEGNAIPEMVYVEANGRRLKMAKSGSNLFSHTFSKLQQDIDFRFAAAGFTSASSTIKVVNRPNLKNFNVRLEYPQYLGKATDRLSNVGNLQIPEGTQVGWQFNTLDADSLRLTFYESGDSITIQGTDNQLFEYQKQFLASDDYEVSLFNAYSENREEIRYAIEVIPDEYPTISLDRYQDTTLYKYIILGGNIADDYGLTRLSLRYRLIEADGETPEDFRSHALVLNSNQSSQSYYERWPVDTLGLKEGDKLEYYVQVWDNDGVNGSKAARTQQYTFALPSKREIEETLERAAESAQQNMDRTLQQAQELREQLEEAEERLRGKNNLDWRDENQMQEMLEQREKLEEAIREMQEQLKNTMDQQEQFSEPDPEMVEKMENLQELMEEVLDPETKKLWEELQRMLEEQADKEQVQDAIENLNQREKNMEQELDRALELFKRLQAEMQLDKALEKAEEVQQKQEQLAQETTDENNSTEDLAEQQEQLQKEFEEAVEEMNEFREMNQDLKRPSPLNDTWDDEQGVKEEQENSQESLQEGERQESQQSQQNAAQKMEQMRQKMEQMSGSMGGMQQMQENLDNLRDIVDNLVKLSFNQEELMNDFREVEQRDPRMVDLSQRQLKLADDAQIVEDSLLSLAQRVFQIQSFVTRELNAMNTHMDNTVEELRDRRLQQALSEQQFTMTSMNNLALLLDDVLDQMQQQMANAMGMGSQQQQDQEGNQPNMSQLQQQLSQQIQQLQQSGKQGRELSEELARMAAQQERLRKAMQRMEQMMKAQPGGEPGGNLQDIIEDMEQSEMDLVNKRLTQDLIERQKRITTRLLEAEEAMRQQEEDEQREGEQAGSYDRMVPEAFEEYIRAKEQEIELLKTVPLQLNPYYKKEVSDYFKRLNDN